MISDKSSQTVAYCRAVGRSENPAEPVLFDGRNLPPWDRVNWSAKMAPLAPPGTTPLSWKANQNSVSLSNGHSIIQPVVNCKELVIFSNKMHKEFQLTNRSVLMSAYKIVIRKCSNIIAQWDKNQCHVFWCKVYVFLQKTLFSYHQPLSQMCTEKSIFVCY